MSYQSYYTATQGLLSQQKRLDIIGNNIANISTLGYKAVRADFKDALYRALDDPSGGNGNLQQGVGALLSATKVSNLQGIALDSDNPLDLCLLTDGYFSVQDEQGNAHYTRDGAFTLSIENETPYLVNVQGMYVLDAQGQRIAMQGEVGAVSIDEQGLMTFVDAQGQAVGTAQLGLYTFDNAQGLQLAGDNLYAAGERSGEAVLSGDVRVKQQALEGSNVDMAVEMTRLIRTQRAFQLSSRALLTADEMEGKANNMRA